MHTAWTGDVCPACFLRWVHVQNVSEFAGGRSVASVRALRWNSAREHYDGRSFDIVLIE